MPINEPCYNASTLRQTQMTAHSARVVVLVAVLIGGSALVPSGRVQTAQPLDELRELAEQGDAAAQSDLGYVYWQGRGVPQNYIEAVRWFHLAADQGHPDAQYGLGFAYKTGQGAPRNDAEVPWCTTPLRAESLP